MTLTIIFASLALGVLWEMINPRRPREFPLFSRVSGNLAMWFFNVIAAALIFAPIKTESGPAQVAAGFLVLDLADYCIHRIKHRVTLLWRLHALHHSDPDLDVSTAVRQHPAEYLATTACYWLIITALGIPGMAVVAHSMTLFALSVATHANTKWPAWLELILQPLLLTQGLHQMHHSADLTEANTNFGAVFSFWDRIFGTYAPAQLVDSFGITGLNRSEACRFLPMLLTPWRIK